MPIRKELLEKDYRDLTGAEQEELMGIPVIQDWTPQGETYEIPGNRDWTPPVTWRNFVIIPVVALVIIGTFLFCRWSAIVALHIPPVSATVYYYGAGTPVPAFGTLIP